jgi:uncharacterized protein YndB with AHSA1/START domain
MRYRRSMTKIRLIRDTLALGGFVVGGAGLADLLLARLARDERGPDPVIRSTVEITAPIERVWEVLADIERQPTWMHEMKEVRLHTPPPTGVGTRGEATVRILGIGVTDPVEVEVHEPPRRFGIRHEGRFGGAGLLTLTPRPGGRSTIVHWEERLIPPVFPPLGAVIQKPILSRIFQGDLERLRAIVEEEERLRALAALEEAAGR